MNKMLIKSADDTLDGILISHSRTIFTTYKNKLKFNRVKYNRNKSKILHFGKTNQCTSIRWGTSGMVIMVKYGNSTCEKSLQKQVGCRLRMSQQ